MTDAIFDFAAINRRMNRKPEPAACACPECVDAIAASEPAYSPSALNQAVREFLRNAKNRKQCNQLQGVADRTHSRQNEALRASLDETDIEFFASLWHPFLRS